MESVGEVYDSCWCSQDLPQEGCRKSSQASPSLWALLSFSPLLLVRWTSWISWRHFAHSCMCQWTNIRAALACGYGLLNPEPLSLSPSVDGWHLPLYPCKVIPTLIPDEVGKSPWDPFLQQLKSPGPAKMRVSTVEKACERPEMMRQQKYKYGKIRLGYWWRNKFSFPTVRDIFY